MDIKRCIALTHEIREHYCLQAITGYPLSVDWFLKVIGEYTQFTIHLMRAAKDYTWSSSNIRGQLHRYDDKKEAYIYLAREKTGVNDKNGINFCESRLIAVKEACHLLIDTEETYTVNNEAFLRDLLRIASGTGIEEGHVISEDVQSEFLAIYCALELLFPFGERDSWVNRIKSEECSYLDIALYYKIPERYVYGVLQGEIHQRLGSIHEQLAASKTY